MQNLNKMMQFSSAVRSLVALNIAAKTIATISKNCRIYYVNKYFFSSLSTFDSVTISVLSSVSLSLLFYL